MKKIVAETLEKHNGVPIYGANGKGREILSDLPVIFFFTSTPSFADRVDSE